MVLSCIGFSNLNIVVEACRRCVPRRTKIVAIGIMKTYTPKQLGLFLIQFDSLGYSIVFSLSEGSMAIPFLFLYPIHRDAQIDDVRFVNASFSNSAAKWWPG